MKRNRGFYSQNYQVSSYNPPMMTEPSGYNASMQSYTFGPNVNPNIIPNNEYYEDDYSDIDNRLTKLERRVKKIENRLNSLDIDNTVDTDKITNNYII